MSIRRNSTGRIRQIKIKDFMRNPIYPSRFQNTGPKGTLVGKLGLTDTPLSGENICSGPYDMIGYSIGGEFYQVPQGVNYSIKVGRDNISYIVKQTEDGKYHFVRRTN